MKKLNLSLVTVLAMSTFAFAGGDIAPVEPMIETPMVEEASTPGAFYLGLGYGMANTESTDTYFYNETPIGTEVSDVDYSTVMLQAGYKFNPYIAVEGRYWFGMDEDYGTNSTLNVDTWAIYAKPMYPVTEQFDIYALLGYASSDVTVTDAADVEYTSAYDVDGFSWGIGGAYAFTESLAVFVDYTSMYDDSASDIAYYNNAEFDNTITAVNFGVTYTF